MSVYYKTGQFARMADVRERTIRYYDTIGLLKPSSVLNNGYRQYSEKDFIKLQKIIALRHLGFSIEEIFPMVSSDENLEDSLKLQTELISTRITQLQVLKDALQTTTRSIQNHTFDWQSLLKLVQLSNRDTDMIRQYKNSKHLNVRIALHERYAQNPIRWFDWVQDQIDYSQIRRLLEVGCGNGRLWKRIPVDLRNREVFLSDSSEGMVDEVRQTLGNDFNCIVADCESIPFKDEYFDAMIANHVLFYLKDVQNGIREIARVLRKGGKLYSSAYGQNHMKEITTIAQKFDSRVILSSGQLYAVFGLENGRDILSSCFNDIELRIYEDQLLVDQAQAVVDYIMSCHGNQNEILGPRIDEFRLYVQSLIDTEGPLRITKEVGLFIARK